jgi:hypothetical protein
MSFTMGDAYLGREASRTWVIKAALMMGIPFVVRSPLSFQIVEWENKV